MSVASGLPLGTAVAQVGLDPLDQLWPYVVRAAWFLGTALAVVVVGWFVVDSTIGRMVRRRNRDNPTIQEAVSRYVRAATLVAAVLVGATAAGYGDFVGSSTLVVAAATLALGVAGQEVIGSLVSGFVLVVDPEFNVGNYIQWDDSEGVVQSITLRVTRVRTPDDRLVTIPNTVLTSRAVTRPYREGRARVVERVAIDYEDDVETALESLERAATDLEAVLDSPPPRAYVGALEPDAVVVRVHYWIDAPRQRPPDAVRSDYARAALAALDEAGVTVSPTSKRELSGRLTVEREG